VDSVMLDVMLVAGAEASIPNHHIPPP